MHKKWRLTEKILTGEKTVELRWYKHKYAPWNKLRIGDTIYFKDSGEPVTIRAEISDFKQFEIKSDLDREKVLSKYLFADTGTNIINSEIEKYTLNKSYCIAVSFINAKRIEPFQIDKTGFGAMTSWICLEDKLKVLSTKL